MTIPRGDAYTSTGSENILYAETSAEHPKKTVMMTMVEDFRTSHVSSQLFSYDCLWNFSYNKQEINRR